jgi:hypothetical protein
MKRFVTLLIIAAGLANAAATHADEINALAATSAFSVIIMNDEVVTINLLGEVKINWGPRRENGEKL